MDTDIIIGYNVTFDLKILQSEFIRNGLEPIPLFEKYVVDPLSIWQKMRPRKLVDAYKEFCGKELINAHSAEADVAATAEVYQAMLKKFKIEDTPIEDLACMSLPPEWIGLSHHIQWLNNTPTFSFGQFQGKPVWRSLQDNSNYFAWMKKKSFDIHIIQVCEQAINKTEDEFIEWVQKAYPNQIET